MGRTLKKRAGEQPGWRLRNYRLERAIRARRVRRFITPIKGVVLGLLALGLRRGVAWKSRTDTTNGICASITREDICSVKADACQAGANPELTAPAWVLESALDQQRLA
ncbi:hypothetical protein soil367_05695 [Hydrocarboniclastica marina]|uniref:Uncharacterized protein n=1 Tax=Hydrocarboniclastica marina TaxID=2259620 RepID=A0A4P7XET5_9ALTE|nr:hypothetical protein soil367_05695 [Hydrocarboniclastica marina]